MATSLKNSSTNVPSKLMVKDLTDAYLGKDVVTHARNAVVNSHQGDLYIYSPEPANLFCVEFPYFYNGSVALKDNRHLVFLTDDTNSEIGIFDQPNCTYTKIGNQSCFNFNRKYPVSGRSKETDICSEVVTFTDNRNPIRRIDLSNIPYTFTEADDACRTKTFTTTIDCEQLNLFRDIKVPSVSVQKTPSGSLPNGAYQVLLSYFVNDEKYSDYYALSIPVHVFDQSGTGGGIAVTFDNLDQEFLQYSVVLVSTNKGISVAKQIGVFSTTQSTITIAENDRPEYITIPLSTLVIRKINYQKAGIISGNSRYMIIADLTHKPKLNYQQAAMQIKCHYVVTQHPANYYENDGQDIGHYRDEVYPFFIRFFYTDGEFTEDVTIGGRKAMGDELTTISGDDVYEFDPVTNLPKPDKVLKYQVVNTAQPMIAQNNPFVNNSRILGTGYMAYHESSINYPDNPAVFGEDACTPIRHHRFPDESIVPRYSIVGNQVYINILGIQFSNIAYPLDDDGNPVPQIAGYEILRGDRSGGNRTVIARGLLTNIRSYNETASGTNQEVLYSNYPYNDLREDAFFSEDQVINRNNNESGHVSPSKVYFDQYNFYTPHAYFNNKYRMGREFIIESEEVGAVTGYFEPVYQHPKSKLLSSFSLYFSLLAGVIEGYLSVNGKKTISTQYNQLDAGGIATGTEIVGVSSTITSVYPTQVISETDSIFKSLNISLKMNPLQIAERIVVVALQALVAAGAFIYASAEFAAAALKIIMGFCGYQQYAYQYNSHGNFAKQGAKPRTGNKRRYALQQPTYLSSAVQTVNSKTFNNFGKQESIYVQFNKPLPAPSVVDDSRRTISSFGTASNPGQQVTSTASAWYATSKVQNPQQYGQVDSVNKVKTANSYIPITGTDPQTSPVLFGGDCIIARFTVLTKQPVFQQSIDNANFPDGTEFNYNLYRNIGHPRYWIDTTFWTMGDLISKAPSIGSLPNSKYNLDGTGNANSTTAWVVQNRYFYLYINGVLDFLVEADYNISLRQEVVGKPFYSKNSTDLTQIFRSDRIRIPEPFVLDQSFYKLQASEIYSQTQRIDYNPTIDTHCKAHDRNSLIYSLAAFKGTKVDNWQYFLPGNYFSFDQNDFGNLTTIKKLDQDRVIFLFDKSSPYVSFGQDELQTTDGRKVTIGDGGLFARPPRELEHTDVYYGNSKSRYAFVSTQYGCFYPSFSQGRIFNFTGQLSEIQNGIHYWCQRYMPIQLYGAFPTYPQTENPFSGVGYFTFFDNTTKTIYISKRDFIPQPNLSISYDPIQDKFLFQGNEVQLQDPAYFEDVSWTLSYSPEQKGFLSFHDWHPDGIIQTENHFITIKGKRAYKHNERCDLYSNFYGIDYPYELEYSVSTGQQVHTVDNLEYLIEGYTFKNNCQDRFHVPFANFDKLIVYNSEQISGLLTPVHETDDPFLNETYPIFNGNGYDILFTKNEQKYRISQFDDITKDRGEVSGNEFALLFSHPSGYKRIINPGAIDFTKDAYQRKNFRHHTNRVWFSLSKVGAIKLLCKYFNMKLTISPR